MEILNYALATFFTFSGLLIGFILAVIAKEELESGKDYYFLIQNLTFALIVFFVLFFNNLVIWLAVVIALLAYIFAGKSKINHLAIYLSLAIIFNASFRNKLSLFIIVASLIFIHGVSTGTILTYKLKNKKLRTLETILIKYGFFIPISLILFLL